MQSMKEFIRKIKGRMDRIDREKAWRWFAVIWLTIFPFLCCAAYCLKTNNLISDLYLPAGLWNDDIIYYKEVEGIVHYGIPQGYFGYSDTHALIGSFSKFLKTSKLSNVACPGAYGDCFLDGIICRPSGVTSL